MSLLLNLFPNVDAFAHLSPSVDTPILIRQLDPCCLFGTNFAQHERTM